jgi:hypothetical protein
MEMYLEVVWLFILSIPVACTTWTVTHEEIFKEPRDYCIEISKTGKNILTRKVFYLFTCEYCFSHYVSLFFVLLTEYTLLLPDWRGYLLAWFSVVWIANVYMSLFAYIRQDIKREKAEIKLLEGGE